MRKTHKLRQSTQCERQSTGVVREAPSRRPLECEVEEDFIRDYGQYIDFDKMPDSYYRDLTERHRWYSLADVERLVGESPHRLRAALTAGTYRSAMRGPHFYVAAEELPRIAQAVDPWRRQHLAILQRERAERLLRRRNKRKGIGRFRPAA